MIVRPRLLLADDHALVLDAFKALLTPAFHIVDAVTDGRWLLEAATRLKPDVIVADINMPQLNGLDACERLKEKLTALKLIFVTVTEDADTASDAIRRGALGYVVKSSAASELFKAIQTVLSGRIYISPSVSKEPIGIFVDRARKISGRTGLTLRQREVLQLLAEGKSMKEAADILCVKTRTIAFHKYQMMGDLGLKRNAQLLQYAQLLGLFGPSQSLVPREFERRYSRVLP